MRLKIILGVAIVVIVGFAGLFEAQQRRIKRLVAENAELRSQLAQVSSLQESNDGLAQQLKSATAASQANQTELLRLRGQGSRLRQLEQENAQLKSEAQQFALQKRQAQAAATAEQGQVTAVSEVAKATADSSHPYATDLGALELQRDIAVRFDLGGGTNRTITPTALSDGNNMMEIKVGVTNADGVFAELATSRLTARPGQSCSISVGNRMVGLAVTLKP